MPQEQQVQFRTALGGVEERVALAVRQQRLLQGEALPACAVARVERQVAPVFEPQQEMQNAAVAQKDLGRFDDPLAQILEPRRQHSDHERPCQQVAVVVHRGDADVHRTGQFRGVPRLPVVMRQHPPEAAQRRGRHPRAQPRHVPFQKRARERSHPARPGRGRPRQIRPRKPAPHPQPVLLLRPHLGERKAADVHEQNPSRQRFGYPLDQVPGRAPQQEEDGLPVGGVTDRTQHLEQARHALHLVEHDQAFALAQHAFGRCGQRLPCSGHFQVEDHGRAVPC